MEKKQSKSEFKILKIINLKTMIILILLLLFNSYAWFIYSTKVRAGMTAHVKAWDIVFKVNENEVISNIAINVDNIYPGMQDFEQSITVSNQGDMLANLTYIVQSLKVLEEIYESGETYTSEDLIDKMSNDYPFKILVEMDDENLYQENGTGSFNVIVEWPFESGDDDLDTYWGEQAYSYHQANPTEPSIYIEVLLSAEQRI